MNQKTKILNLLRERKESGATNIELNSICFRYGARIADLRADGYTIQSIKVKGSKWKFVLSEPVKIVEPRIKEQMPLI